MDESKKQVIAIGIYLFLVSMASLVVGAIFTEMAGAKVFAIGFGLFGFFWLFYDEFHNLFGGH